MSAATPSATITPRGGGRETPASAAGSSSGGIASVVGAASGGGAGGVARVSTSGDSAGIDGLVRFRYSAVDSDGALVRWVDSATGGGSAVRGGLGLVVVAMSN